MLLDAIIVLVCLIVVGIIAALMAVTGIHAYRLFGAVFGLVTGFGIVHYLNPSIAGLNITGAYLIAEYAFFCIVFALLGFFVKAFALGMGGAVTGFLYGTGIVNLVDYALGYSIPPAVFTASCVAVIIFTALYCLLRPRAGAILATSLTGTYSVAAAIYLMIAWYHSTSSVSPVLSFEAIINEFKKLFASVQPEVNGILLAAGLLTGILFMILQYRSTRPSVVISKQQAKEGAALGQEQPEEYAEPMAKEAVASKADTVQVDNSAVRETEIPQTPEQAAAITKQGLPKTETQAQAEKAEIQLQAVTAEQDYKPEPQKFPPRRSFKETASKISKKYLD